MELESGTIGLVSAIGLVAFFVGFALLTLWRKGKARLVLQSAEEKGAQIIEEAKKQSRNIQKEAELGVKDDLLKMKMKAEDEIHRRREELSAVEKRILSKEDNLDRKYDQIEKKENELRGMEREVESDRKKVAELEKKNQEMIEASQRTLERLSGTTSEEAKKKLVESLASEAKHEAAKQIKIIEEEAKEEADKKAKKIMSLAIERLAGEWVQEVSVSVVKLPSDDMKGRVIGREGRNIKALEASTGVDLIVDDAPGTVVLSSHNPIRREIARISLERLLVDGRIHPARIEEMLGKVTQEVDKSIREAGQQALFELDIHGVHPEIMKLLGALKFRYSYAQNVLRHSIEVGFICGIMAAELGMDQKLARRAGLLHDIGKAVSHEIEGSHAVIGGELLKKYGETKPVVHSVWAHHEDIPPEEVLDHLVAAADALSGARPGARMESAETYVKRLEDLENIATSCDEVEKAFAIQAGRELRVMVQPGKINDEQAVVLCKDLARKIESGLTYPGQIKVVVIRETRSIGYAK